MPGQGYSIEAERCYFVADSYGDVWRIVFTGFGGSATGEITFGLLEAGTIANSVQRQLNPFDSTPIRWHQGNH